MRGRPSRVRRSPPDLHGAEEADLQQYVDDGQPALIELMHPERYAAPRVARASPARFTGL